MTLKFSMRNVGKICRKNTDFFHARKNNNLIFVRPDKNVLVSGETLRVSLKIKCSVHFSILN